MNLKKNLILAVETAIDGGSVSILEGQTEIDFWVGTSEVSKAEDILEGILNLLERNKLKRAQIGLVAVSTEAGSLTGLKIGLATAKGLAKAFGCRLCEVSLWDALAKMITSKGDESATVFFPGGKHRIGRRDLTHRKFVSEIQFINADQFQAHNLDVGNMVPMFAHNKIIQQTTSAENSRLIDLGGNLAFYIGNYASDNE